MDGNPNARMSAKNGTYTVNDTSAVTGKKFTGIYVSSDAVFADLEVNGSATDVRSTYISTVGGTVSAGTVITAIGDDYFSGVTLTSGEVTLILR
jgi:hypothetical protein